jgi:hypothetical protein
MVERQIKSRERVSERGEVFTAEREVNAMLDLVKQETERIDSRFLEPACGTGNFLVEILRRKLEVIRRQYQKHLSELELQTTIAVSSIYGVDIMKDNVEECCKRLHDIVCKWYSEVHPLQKAPSQKLSDVWSYLLHRNILWGDALTLREPVGEKATIIEKQNAKPITFSEWSFISDMVMRKDFHLAALVQAQSASVPFMKNDQGNEVFLPPEPIREYRPIHYLKIATYYDTKH